MSCVLSGSGRSHIASNIKNEPRAQISGLGWIRSHQLGTSFPLALRDVICSKQACANESLENRLRIFLSCAPAWTWHLASLVHDHSFYCWRRSFYCFQLRVRLDSPRCHHSHGHVPFEWGALLASTWALATLLRVQR